MKNYMMVVEVEDHVDVQKEMGWTAESGIYLKEFHEVTNKEQAVQVEKQLAADHEKVYFYDVYTDDGNVAYLESNISEEEMERLENDYMEKYPFDKDEEDRSGFIDRFLDYLRENEQYRIKLHLRPDYSLFIGL